jgi:hypothetical protein
MKFYKEGVLLGTSIERILILLEQLQIGIVISYILLYLYLSLKELLMKLGLSLSSLLKTTISLLY